MNKKALLTTIATLMLILPLFLLAKSHFDSASERQINIVESDIGNIIAFVYDDIASDYLELIEAEFEISENGWINFSQFGSNSNYSSSFARYSVFLTVYQSRINLNLDITNFYPHVNFSIYNSSAVFDNDLIYYAGESVEEIHIEVRVNKSGVSTNSSPSDTGSVALYVSIINANGDQLLDDTLANLRTNGNNQPFQVEFDDGSSIEIQFERYNRNDATLYTVTSGLQANITNFDVKYPDSEITVFSDSVLLIKHASGINRTDSLLLS